MKEIKVGDRVNAIEEPTINLCRVILGKSKNLIVSRIKEEGDIWYHLSISNTARYVSTLRNQIELSHKINKIRRLE